MGTYAVRHTSVEIKNDTRQPISGTSHHSIKRMYVYLLDPISMTYGIYSHYSGRRRWLFVVPPNPTFDEPFRVGTVDMDFPSNTGPNPFKFKIESEVPGSNIKYVKNELYDKYLCANVTNDKFILRPTLPDDGTGNHMFHSETSTGPVIPVTEDVASHGTAPTFEYQYFIHAHTNNGIMALTASPTAPYLTLTPRNFNSMYQRFFFRRVGNPNIVFPGDSFTYNMYSVTDPGKVYSFTPPTAENDGIAPASELSASNVVLAVMPAYNPSTFIGRFLIYCNDNDTHLRATGNNVTVVASATAVPSTGDYFSFMPVVGGLV
eukprot:GDKK01077940.1.p1 GENE.GDKK01077940.1~~GDKK01077940.1.p1  ORF type:complete len:319 (+),score=-4.51 GDKK01077940.1:1-957(+)